MMNLISIHLKFQYVVDNGLSYVFTYLDYCFIPLIACILARLKLLSLMVFVEIHFWVSSWLMISSLIVCQRRASCNLLILLVGELSKIHLMVLPFILERFLHKIGVIIFVNYFGLFSLFYLLNITQFACPFDCTKREKKLYISLDSIFVSKLFQAFWFFPNT